MKNLRIVLPLVLCTFSMKQISANTESINNQQLNTTTKQEITSNIPEEYRGIANDIEKLFDDALAQATTQEQKEAIIQLRQEGVRAILAETNATDHGSANVEFSASVYDQETNKLYAGASSATPNKSALIRGNQKSTNPRIVDIVSLAPADVTLNGVKGVANNPLFDNPVTSVKQPMALVGGTNNRSLAVISDSDTFKVNLVTNLSDGSSVLQSDTLKDAAGPTDINKSIWAIAGTRDKDPIIFAAVSKTGSTWIEATDDTTDGIALLKTNGNTIQQTSANDITDFTTPKAVGINFTAKADDQTNMMVAFKNAVSGDLANATIASNNVPMHWDNNLQRLFIGLEGVQHNADNLKGGVISLLVGGIDADSKTPFIKPIVVTPNNGGTPTFPEANVGNQIIGFATQTSTAGSNKYFSSTNLVKTMHTSTNKNYVIVNGGSGTDIANADTTNTWIYALPIMPADNNNAGQLAATDGSNNFVIADGTTGLVTVDQSHVSNFFLGTEFNDNEKKSVVGTDPRLLAQNTQLPIQNMHVVGDTIYVSVAGDRSDLNKEAGIFQSTALFDQDGLIRSWTPWQRVAGPDAVKEVTGFGLSTDDGSFQFITKDTAVTGVYKEIATNAWGQSNEDSATDRKLTSQLNEIFKDKNGIYKVVNFERSTNGFKLDEFSMIAAISGDTIALVQTGEIGNAPGMIKPTNDFSAAGKVLILNDQTLKDIAPLTSATFVENDNSKSAPGYLLIGGLGGLVRIDQDADGAGINTKTNPVSDLTPFNGKTFKKISNYTNIIDLQNLPFGHAGTAIVATLDKVFVINASDPMNPETIVQASGNDLNFNKQFVLDAQNSNELIIAATTQGLAAWKRSDGSPVAFPTIQGTPVQMHLLQYGLGGSGDGNLYVLSIDRDENASHIYRFDINGEIITPIDVKTDGITPAPVKDLKQFTHMFTTDGSTTFIARSQEITNDMLQVDVNNYNDDTDAFNVIDSRLALANDPTPPFYIGTPVRDTTSGGWIVPGSFGVRVNE